MTDTPRESIVLSPVSRMQILTSDNRDVAETEARIPAARNPSLVPGDRSAAEQEKEDLLLKEYEEFQKYRAMKARREQALNKQIPDETRRNEEEGRVYTTDTHSDDGESERCTLQNADHNTPNMGIPKQPPYTAPSAPRKAAKRKTRRRSPTSSEDSEGPERRGYARYHEAFKSLRFKSPFTDDINEVPIPKGLKPPHIKKYDGTGDPEGHISDFLWAVKTVPMDPRLWCIYFAGSLNGPAQYWLDSLPSRSIGSFEQLCDDFSASFIQQRRFQGEAHSIFACRQRDGESNKTYLGRFNSTSREMPSRSDPMVIAAFTYGLRPGPLFKKLVTKNFKSIGEMLEKVNKYIRQEEEATERFREESRANRGERFKTNPSKIFSLRPHSQARFQRRRRESLPRQEAYDTRNQTSYVQPQRGTPRLGHFARDNRYPRDKNAYCDFHKQSGHSTDQCEAFKKEKEQAKTKAGEAKAKKNLALIPRSS